MIKITIIVVIVLLVDMLIISAFHGIDKKGTCCQHECPYGNNYCCWRCFMGGECQSACKLNPNECEKREAEE